jgi:hypothetical protein
MSCTALLSQRHNLNNNCLKIMLRLQAKPKKTVETQSHSSARSCCRAHCRHPRLNSHPYATHGRQCEAIHSPQRPAASLLLLLITVHTLLLLQLLLLGQCWLKRRRHKFPLYFKVEVTQKFKQAQPHFLQCKAVADAHASARAKRQVGGSILCCQVLVALQAASST